MNVRAVISDIRAASISGNVVSFASDVKSFTDYYAFGWAMPGRNFSAGEYRFGFNGKESAPELYGEGASYDFGARMLDARLGRWGSCDNAEAKYPELTPYHFACNTPIRAMDRDGNDTLMMMIKKNLVLSTKTSTVYDVTLSVVENGKHRILTGSEFPNMYLLGNPGLDEDDDNALMFKEFYKLTYDKMSKHPNWLNTVLVHDKSDRLYEKSKEAENTGVFFHQGADHHWIGGCKILTEKLVWQETEVQNGDKWEKISEPITELEASKQALAKLRNLYDSYAPQLTGDKFLLENVESSRSHGGKFCQPDPPVWDLKRLLEKK